MKTITGLVLIIIFLIIKNTIKSIKSENKTECEDGSKD